MSVFLLEKGTYTRGSKSSRAESLALRRREARWKGRIAERSVQSESANTNERASKKVS